MWPFASKVQVNTREDSFFVWSDESQSCSCIGGPRDLRLWFWTSNWKILRRRVVDFSRQHSESFFLIRSIQAPNVGFSVNGSASPINLDDLWFAVNAVGQKILSCDVLQTDCFLPAAIENVVLKDKFPKAEQDIFGRRHQTRNFMIKMWKRSIHNS